MDEMSRLLRATSSEMGESRKIQSIRVLSSIGVGRNQAHLSQEEIDRVLVMPGEAVSEGRGPSPRGT